MYEEHIQCAHDQVCWEQAELFVVIQGGMMLWAVDGCAATTKIKAIALLVPHTAFNGYEAV